jgi:hypothetical protein
MTPVVLEQFPVNDLQSNQARDKSVNMESYKDLSLVAGSAGFLHGQ